MEYAFNSYLSSRCSIQWGLRRPTLWLPVFPPQTYEDHKNYIYSWHLPVLTLRPVTIHSLSPLQQCWKGTGIKLDSLFSHLALPISLLLTNLLFAHTNPPHLFPDTSITCVRSAPSLYLPPLSASLTILSSGPTGNLDPLSPTLFLEILLVVSWSLLVFTFGSHPVLRALKILYYPHLSPVSLAVNLSFWNNSGKNDLFHCYSYWRYHLERKTFTKVEFLSTGRYLNVV